MTCPRCDSEKEAGSMFCRSCGADLRGPCPDCGRNASMGCAYCRSCGRRLEPPPRRSAVETMALIAGLFGAVVLLVEIVTAWVRIGDVVGIAGSVSFGAVYWLSPAPESIIWLSGNWVILMYVAEAAVVTFCLYRLLREQLRISKEGRPVDSPAVRIPLIYSMVYVMNLAILALSGWDVSTPDIGESGSAMIQLMHASVYEELYCRVLALGVPILAVSYILGDRETPAKRFLLGGFGYRKWMLAFVLLSSLLFGMAHYDGWGLWKILPSFVMGVFLSYLFIRYGLYAAVSMHFLTDFALAGTWLTGSVGGSVLTTLPLLGAVFFGLSAFVVFGREAASAIRERRIL